MATLNYKFKVYFKQNESKIGLKDLTDYSDPSVIRGIMKIVSPDGVEYINPGFESDSFVSPDLDDSNGLYNPGVAVTMIDNFKYGTWEFYYKIQDTGTGEITSLSKTYWYQLPRPTITVSHTFSRIYSTLTLTDTTNYRMLIPANPAIPLDTSTYADPTNITRVLKISPPPLSGQSDAVSATTSVVFGPNCYTGQNDFIVSGTGTYEVADWGAVNWVTAILEGTYEGYTVLTGDSNFNCFLTFSSCITAINEKYEGLLNTNPNEARLYEKMVNKISFYWGLFNIYIDKGTDTAYVTDKLKTLLRQVSDCDVDSASTVTEILPSGTNPPTGGGSSTNNWSNGTTIPDSTYGDDDDYFLNTTNSRIYKKISGTWTHIMTIESGSVLRDSLLVTSDYTITNDDEFLVVEAESSDIILSLDSISNFDDEKIITIKAKKMTYSITIEAASIETIEERSSYSVGTEGDTIMIRPYSSNWEIV